LKAVLLAGGTGTRLRPLTKLYNKHMLPVGDRPMIGHAIAKVKEAGITDVVLVTGRESAGSFIAYLGSGREEGLSITYRIQEKAGGIAEALAQAESAIGPDDKIVVMLGDNLFEEPLGPHAKAFEAQPDGAMVLLKRVDDPRRYGVPVFGAEGRIARIEEKPERPASDLCVTGIYFYHADVFGIIRRLKPSRRGELEITDVNNVYAAAGKLTHRTLAGWWTDAGTFDSLHEAAERMRRGRR
jgi:glucose-1-phosphate thymidylyltransferase